MCSFRKNTFVILELCFKAASVPESFPKIACDMNNRQPFLFFIFWRATVQCDGHKLLMSPNFYLWEMSRFEPRELPWQAGALPTYPPISLHTFSWIFPSSWELDTGGNQPIPGREKFWCGFLGIIFGIRAIPVSAFIGKKQSKSLFHLVTHFFEWRLNANQSKLHVVPSAIR